MRRYAIALIVAGALLAGGLVKPTLAAAGADGAIVAVGGGDTNAAVVARTLELAGGRNAVVAVLPQSSALPDAGESSVETWKKAGARDALKVSFDDRAEARRVIESATLIWMPGGDQNRFMSAIAGTGLDDLSRARHAAGVTVGGTSAGAAILSKVMLTGEADLKGVGTGTTATAPGLGLWPDVIVDQHFLARQRESRLISVVLDHPALVGVGIDEGTGRRARHADRSSARAQSSIDARGAKSPPASSSPIAAGPASHFTLRSGMTLTSRGRDVRHRGCLA
jgi:cyanophycinase